LPKFTKYNQVLAEFQQNGQPTDLFDHKSSSVHCGIWVCKHLFVSNDLDM